jgi:hypothetical protein
VFAAKANVRSMAELAVSPPVTEDCPPLFVMTAFQARLFAIAKPISLILLIFNSSQNAGRN